MSDRGFLVIGWMTKLVMGFALFAVVAFDGVAILVGNFGAADDAVTAAASAADAYRSSKDVQTAYDAAVAALARGGDTVETDTFSVDSAGHVTLTIDRSPTTLWIQHVGPLKKWALVRQTATGSPPS